MTRFFHICSKFARVATAAPVALAVLCLVAPASAQTHPDDIYWDSTFVVPEANSRVRDVKTHDGDVYVTGDFWQIGGVVARGVARWDGSAWHAVGDGTPVYGDCIGINNGMVFVAGAYRDAAAVLHSPVIGRWDGTQWHFETIVSNWGDHPVNILKEVNGELYMGGRFSHVGGNYASALARWAGSEWEGVGPGLLEGSEWRSPVVEAIATDGDVIYVGGNFGGAGSVPANNMIIRDGDTWRQFGPTGQRGSVWSMLWGGDGLYVGGEFTIHTENGGAMNIAFWDGSVWHSLGDANGRVSALAISDGQLYAGGRFTAIGGVASHRLARWDGVEWSTPGSGLSASDVIAVAARPGGEVFPVGTISTAGGHPVNDLARWRNPAPYPKRPTPGNGGSASVAGVTLSWSSAGDNPPPVTWDLYLGSINPPPLVRSDLSQPVYETGVLDYATTYYWRAVAHDESSNHATGTLWSFTTEDTISSWLVASSALAACGPMGEDTVTVIVGATGMPMGFSAGGFDLEYDPQRLTFVSCEPGDMANWALFDYFDHGGVIRIGGTTNEPLPPGSSGEFAILRFAAHCCGNGESETSVRPVNLIDDLIAQRVVDGSVRCIVPEADGDVNGDGVVTVSDAYCTFEGYLERPGALPNSCVTTGWDVRADVNCDGNVTPGDALCIFEESATGACILCSETGDGSEPGAEHYSPGAAQGFLGVALSGMRVEEDEMILELALEGAGDLSAFGFEMHYRNGSVRLLGATPGMATEAFDELQGRHMSPVEGRVGGYSRIPAPVTGGEELLTLRLRILDPQYGDELEIRAFVDDLEGTQPIRVAIPAPASPYQDFVLHQNFPNPFNPTTEIQYEVPEGAAGARITLAVYDVRGARVRTLEKTVRHAGIYSVSWDGRNDQGQRVASGVYFYSLRSGLIVRTRKLVLMK